MKLYLNMKKKSFIVFLISFLFLIDCYGYSKINSDSLNKKKLFWYTSSECLLAGTSLIALDRIWYSKYPKTHFHTFNDSKDWLQMDKVGHGVTSYYISYIGYELFNDCNLKKNQSILIGSATGLAYLTSIEIMDGFYDQWGFSYGDMTANILGVGLFSLQQYFWNQQRIKLKYSFHKSGIAQYRPELLGNNLYEQLLKDYNGQTYWLSANINSFLKKNSKFPSWINVALGYGADGMIGGSNNNYSLCNGDPNCINLTRKRQFYISLDADLTKIKWKSKFMKMLSTSFGFIKIPFPALEINPNASKFHWIYF